MAGAVGSGPKDALQTAVVVCLYVLGLVAAGSLLVVVLRACYSSWGLCHEPLPPRYGKMDAQEATQRRREDKARKVAAAEARRARDARGEEPSPLPSPSGSSLGSADVGYDLEAGEGGGEEEVKAPEPAGRSQGERSGVASGAQDQGLGSGLPPPSRFRLPPPPRRRGLVLYATATAGGAGGGGDGSRLVAPIPRRPSHLAQQQQSQPPLQSLPTLVPGRRSSASPTSDTSSSSAGSAGSTRPRARAVGDGGDVFGVRRGMMMAVP